MDPFLGQLMLVPYSFVPKGWLACDGRLLPISSNEPLFSLLGTTYGGDGRSTFALPDLRGRVPVSQGAGPGLSPYFLGQMGGWESVTLLQSQIPQHTHMIGASTAESGQASPQGAVPAAGGAYATTPNTTLNPATCQPAGGSQPHENRQPFLTLQWIIATEGVYPSRQ